MSEVDKPGEEALWLWFGLSYARYLVLPRVLMHEMSDDWQGRMAQLLREYNETFPNQPDIGTRVYITKNGKLTKAPSWLLNYRRPDRETIKTFRAF